MKEEKLKAMKAIQEEKELDGCTFAPKLVGKKAKNQGEEKRDV